MIAGLNRDVHVEIGPIQMMRMRELNVAQLADRDVSEPGEMLERQEPLALAEQEPESMLRDVRDLNDRNGLSTRCRAHAWTLAHRRVERDEATLHDSHHEKATWGPGRARWTAPASRPKALKHFGRLRQAARRLPNGFGWLREVRPEASDDPKWLGEVSPTGFHGVGWLRDV